MSDPLLVCRPPSSSCSSDASPSDLFPYTLLNYGWEVHEPAKHSVSMAAAAGDLVARMMQLHLLAEATADALLLGRALQPSDEAALVAHWPWLLHLSAVSPSGPAMASPFAAAANITLFQRPCPPGVTPASLTFPPLNQHAPGAGTALQFDLAADALPDQCAELQVFVQHVNRAIEQSSKEALEDTLSELSRLPSAAATAMVRGSIEGQRTPEMLASVRSMLLRRSGSLPSAPDSLAVTPTRLSLS